MGNSTGTVPHCNLSKMEQFCVDKKRREKNRIEKTVPPQNTAAPVDNFELLGKGRWDRWGM
ncbi:MAG: hypothetical protein ACI8Q6_002553 [Granulosicoccus sp.]